jgi:hypothetical protein
VTHIGVTQIKDVIGRRISVRLPTVAAMVAMQVLLTVACALSVRQNISLAERVEIYRKWSAPLTGRDVPAITGLDRTGARRTVEYDRDPRPTLIYSFTQNCGACRANWQAMKAIQQLSPDRLRIVYLNTKDELPEAYLLEHGLTRDVLFTKLDPFSEVSYQVRATPQTELVDKTGRVVWTNVGAFRSDDLTALVGAIEKLERQSLEANKGAGR